MMIHKRRRGTAIVETEKGILLTAGRGRLFITPGGGAGIKESRMQAAIRELKEETGLEPYFAMALFRYYGRIHGKFQDEHTVYYIKAKGSAMPRKEVKYLAYYKPHSDINVSEITKDIISEFHIYKAKNEQLFEILNTLWSI